MFCGIAGEDLMVRVGTERYEQALSEPHTQVMDFTGRPMRGFVFVEPEAVDSDKDLEYWVKLCLDFNPKAKRSRKKC